MAMGRVTPRAQACCWNRSASGIRSLAGVTDVHGTKRLALVGNRGTCRICGGRLRFYAKVTASREEFDPQTRRWHTVVTERTAVAECVRNRRRHVWEIDPTDTDDLNMF